MEIKHHTNKNLLEQKNILLFLTVIIILLGIFIRTKLLVLNPSYWVDTYALAINLDSSYKELFEPLSCMQVAPPFFLVVSKFIYNLLYVDGNLETKDLIIRLLPYICGTLSLPLFALLLHNIFKNNFLTFAGTSLLAFNKCAINYSIEYKQYSCELLCSILLLLLFYSIEENKISNKKLALYSLAFTIIPWFSNSSWIIMLCGIMYLSIKLILRKQKSFSSVLIIIVPFFINLFVFYTQFYSPIYNHSYEFMHKYWEQIPAFFNIRTFNNLFPNKVNDLIPLFSNGLFWIFLSTNMTFLFLSKNKKNIFFILTPIAITIIASFLNMYPFHNRLILFLLPLFIMLYIQFLSIIKDKKILKYLVIFLITLLSINHILVPTEAYITYKSITRELFYTLKEKNPELKNVISDEAIFAYQSDNKEYLSDNMFDTFEHSNIKTYIKTLPVDKYWIYVPYGKKEYMNDLFLFLNTNKEIKSLKFYYPQKKSWDPVGTEKHAFIAEFEL